MLKLDSREGGDILKMAWRVWEKNFYTLVQKIKITINYQQLKGGIYGKRRQNTRERFNFK